VLLEEPAAGLKWFSRPPRERRADPPVSDGRSRRLSPPSEARCVAPCDANRSATPPQRFQFDRSSEAAGVRGVPRPSVFSSFGSPGSSERWPLPAGEL